MLDSINHAMSDSLLIQATQNIHFSGTNIFDQISSSGGELSLVARRLSFAPETSISYSGNYLKLGSQESMDLIEVDLHAEGEIHTRSLDSLVILNSEMATSGNGSDFVHLRAHHEMSVNNLRFSDQIKKITMEAMTINLHNLNFPAGSSVNLNSAYGGIDGRYPSFGRVMYGRVNFIENIRYSSNLIMDRPSFDQHADNITIGKVN